MKIFNKLPFIFLLLVLSSKSYSQDIILKAGLNLATFYGQDYEDDVEGLKIKPGFHFGGVVELPISEILSLEAGLVFSTKGSKYHEADRSDDYVYDSKFNLNYINLPVTAKINFNIGDVKIFGTAGPNLGYGMTGKSKSTEYFKGKTTKQSYNTKWGSGTYDDLRRVDFGVIAGIGVEISSIIVGVNYDLGLLNIAANPGDGTIVKNRVFALSIGYRL